jgi:hypothetical protein
MIARTIVQTMPTKGLPR